MSAPTVPAPRAQHLADAELVTLRRALEGERDAQAAQVEENEAFFHALAAGTGVDASGIDRDLARTAADRAREALDDIDRALRRLDDGSYGTCTGCGQPIPFERLSAIPHTEFCVSCPRTRSLFR
jgi:RNA polymerase-binding protein DksA